MNKKDLIEAIYSELPVAESVSKAAIARVLDAQAAVISDHLASCDLWQDSEVTLPGLGKLIVRDRAARTGRNPRTGEVIDIPTRRTVKFRASKALTDAVGGE